MRYHRARVRNFRGIEEVAVEFPAGQLLVIEGPNEAGKSSFAEALHLLFEYPADSNAQEVREARPEGRDVDPEVELEFRAGPYRCRYRKVFGRRGVTELEVLAPREEQLTGREAHDRARALLAETSDAALVRALRVLQGQSLLLPEGVASSPALQRALDAAGGSDPGGESLFERARAEFARYYTEARRQETGPLADARKAFEKAHADVERLEERVRAFEERSQRALELEAQVAATGTAVAELTALVQALRAAASAYEEARERLEAAEAKRDLAWREVERLEQEVREREQSLGEVARLETELETLERELSTARAGLEQARTEVAEAGETLVAVRAQLADVGELERVAAEDLAYANDVLQVDQMARRLEQIELAEEEARQAQAFLAACRMTTDRLRAIEEAAEEVRQDEGRARGVRSTVEVRAEAAVEVGIGKEVRRVGPAEPLALEVTEELEIRLPGGLVVVVRPGETLSRVKERLAERRQRLAELLAEAGAATVEEARQLEERRKEAERARAEAGRRTREALFDLSSAEELRGKLERTQREVEAYRVRRAGGAPLPASPGEARRAKEAAEQARAALASAANQAEERDRRAKAAEREAESRVTQLEERARATRSQLAAARERAERAAQRPEAELAGELEAARGRLVAEQRELDARAQVARGVRDVSRELAAAERDLEQAAGRLERTREELAGIRGVLAHEGESTLAAELDEARAQQERRAEELERLERRAKGARRLFETLERHREAAQRAYAPRLAAEVERLGRQVFGESFRVELGNDLELRGRTLDGTTLEFGRLSTGAQEQLAVLYRAACAALAGEGGVPFFLDDALGWSDARRLDDMARVLAGLAKSVQVVVLTCQPGRFAAAEAAATVRIAAGRMEEAGESRDGTQPALM